MSYVWWTAVVSCPGSQRVRDLWIAPDVTDAVAVTADL
jgi:hypothetical protein